MPNNPLTIRPNIPLHVALVDPEGQFDFDIGIGRYETASGQVLTLPRPAVVLLNALSPQPGEELVITQHWSGKPGEPREWTVELAHSVEIARAVVDSEASRLTEQLEASIGAIQSQGAVVANPTPIRAPLKRGRKPESPQELFDRGVEIVRGNGTHGPAPAPLILPAAAISSPVRKPGQIPANIAVAEILAFITLDPNTQNWGDQAKQDLASTVIIAAYKAGHIGLWERGQ